MENQNNIGSKLNRKASPVLFAILAALFFGLNAPFSKLLVRQIDPLFLAALLYLGAGAGMLVVQLVRDRKVTEIREARLSRQELPFIILMILLDIAAPVSLMLGISLTNASTAALLGNFEIAATTFFALVLFKEAVGKRMWLAISLIFIASILLSFNDLSSVQLSTGALLVLLSCLLWGIENNLTRKLSIKDPLQVVILKGFGSGSGALLIVLIWGSFKAAFGYVLLALLLGFVAYGASIYFYVKAQRNLGASRTSAYYAAAPFIGVLLSFAILREPISLIFLVALMVMVLGVALAFSESHQHTHVHLQEVHEHRHAHDDGHHDHIHPEEVSGEHSHVHTHLKTVHKHSHLPDVHHQHKH